jgi:hypothetical protein
LFDFVIVNNSDTTMICTHENKEWIERIVRYVSKNGPDMFLPSNREFLCVYSEDGKEIGTPYSGMFCGFSNNTWKTIPSHSTYHIQCLWKETGAHNAATYPLCGPDPENDDFPIGKYSVSFSIKYREKANDSNSKFKKAIFKYPFEVL